MSDNNLQKLQAALKSKIEAAQVIENAAGGNPMTAEQLKAYRPLVADMTLLKEQVDLAQKSALTSDWANRSQGSVVGGSFNAAFTRPAQRGEGDMKDLYWDERNQEFRAYKSAFGEEKLKAYLSDDYRDGFDQAVRNVYKKGVPSITEAFKTLPEKQQYAMKVMNEGTDSGGGAWVPPDMRSELIKREAAMTVVRANASVFTTGSDVMSFPRVNYTGSSSDDPTGNLFTSGVRAGWQDSAPLAAALTEGTNPIAGRVNIPVQTATAALFMTREQLEDNQFDITGYLSQILAEAFFGLEEYAFIQGPTASGNSGILTGPQGILNHANIAVSSTGVGMQVKTGVAAALSWMGVASGSTGTPDPTKGVVGAVTYLPPQYENGAAWYGSKNAYGNVLSLVDLQQRPLWIPPGSYPNYTNGLPSDLLGFPVRKSQFFPSVGAGNVPLIFGNMKGYYIADRVGMSIEVFRETRALYGEVVIYARKRVGGQLVQDWQLKALTCST